MRHSLSLSRNFRRIGVKAGDVKMKKGLEWEVIPERREAVEREVELYNESVKSTGDASCLPTKQAGDGEKSAECGEEGWSY